ncbi:MAG: hypothetical protein HY079_04465 [Elusimicrobia bacterium]|nr:hypothetical protein [Elusimicrobiota bacterium]
MKTAIAALAAVLLLSASAVLAHEGEAGREKSEKEHFAEMKAGMLKDVDAQIAALQKYRACAADAADHLGMKKCNEEKEAAMKGMWKAKKAERLQRIEEQQKRLDEEKAKLKQEDAKP